MAVYLLEVIEDIKEDIKTSSEFHLYLSESYTNRFNPSISIKNAIPDTQNVNSTIYQVLGNEIPVIVNLENPAEQYELKFYTGNLANGIHVYRFDINGKIISNKCS